MTPEHATIFWPDQGYDSPAKKLYALPDHDQDLLTVFFNQQVQDLQDSGGGEKRDVIAEWKSGWVVSWDIELKPKYQKPNKLPGPPSPGATLGSYYRIVVTRIWKIS
jgi:hypothetical protein